MNFTAGGRRTAAMINITRPDIGSVKTKIIPRRANKTPKNQLRIVLINSPAFFIVVLFINYY
jgi:hypothetical protein